MSFFYFLFLGKNVTFLLQAEFLAIYWQLENFVQTNKIRSRCDRFTDKTTKYCWKSESNIVLQNNCKHLQQLQQKQQQIAAKITTKSSKKSQRN